MAHFIIDTYKIKWEILNLARNFSGDLSASDAKFFCEELRNISAQGNKFRLLRTFVSVV